MDRDGLVYSFDNAPTDSAELLGSKGAGLVTMTKLELPVPPGFTITTQACRNYFAIGDAFLSELWQQLAKALGELERVTGKRFGDASDPLIVSVRSGAVASMPGMLETILNVGINDVILEGLERNYGAKFALSSYLRLIRMFGTVALGIDPARFDAAEKQGLLSGLLRSIVGTDERNLADTLDKYRLIFERDQDASFPQDPLAQLQQAIVAVFNSWSSPRATSYRQLYGIPDDLGTAVTVQMMVFGNRDVESGTGVALTRDPKTGEHQIAGEYLIGTQGEDLVAGRRTPRHISELQLVFPNIYNELVAACQTLERHYKYVQDVEFTIEHGKLWLLQTRNAPLDLEATVRIAVEMVEEELLDQQEALARVPARQVHWLSRDHLAEAVEEQAIDDGLLIAKGFGVSSGMATGIATFTVDEAVRKAENGEAVILVRPQLEPDDITGMWKAAGIVASRGGATSHSALIVRNMGKPCVVGCETILIDETSECFPAPGRIVRSGDILTVSGDTGRVFYGSLPTEKPRDFPELSVFRAWLQTRPFPSAWSFAAYPQQTSPGRDYLAIARQILTESPWFTEKANVVEALKLLHPDIRIRQEVAEAHDVQTIREQMYDVIRSGYWNGPRTCYHPSALGKAGWQMAIETVEEVDEFLNDPEYDGFSGAGGYLSWIKDPNLKEIITVYDPPKLGLPKFEDEHFVFTVSCGTNPDQVLIEMNIGTAQLRSLEGAGVWGLVHAVMELDPSRYHNKGRQVLVIGGKYLQQDVIQRIADLFARSRNLDAFPAKCVDVLGIPDKLTAHRVCSAIVKEVPHAGSDPLRVQEVAAAITGAMRNGEIPLDTYSRLVEPIPLRIARQVMDAVFNKWWERPYDLPFAMQALEEVFQLQILEVQGHFGSDGQVDYMLVYDAKGREENIMTRVEA